MGFGGKSKGHTQGQPDFFIDLHPLHYMDPVVAASIELAMALPANDSILDTLSTEMLAVMLVRLVSLCPSSRCRPPGT
jgi:hypothetical protein